MKFTPTPLKGVITIEPNLIEDDRGYFFESYHKDKFHQQGILDEFVQDNQSYSTYGTLRGLHFQKQPFAQAKLVRVLAGEVYDVVVDIRKDSPTYRKWYGIFLNEKNKTLMYIPEGFAHGFCVTSDQALFAYKCSRHYNKDSESGIRWDDPELAISWPIKTTLIVSQKDQELPLLSKLYD